MFGSRDMAMGIQQKNSKKWQKVSTNCKIAKILKNSKKQQTKFVRNSKTTKNSTVNSKANNEVITKIKQFCQIYLVLKYCIHCWFSW